MRENSARANIHSLLKVIFADYANLLRQKYPRRIIRNAEVFDSAIQQFSRFGYIVLVNRDMSAELPDRTVQILKRVKHFPIWIMGPNFPDSPTNMFDQLRLSMQGDKIIWHHRPSRSKPTWPQWRAKASSPPEG